MLTAHRGLKMFIFVVVLVGVLLVAFVTTRFAPLEPVGAAYLQKVRSINTADFGVLHPAGLAFAPQAQVLLVLETPQPGQPTNTESGLALVTLVEESGGAASMVAAFDAWNLAFDSVANRVLVLDPAVSQLIAIPAGPMGDPVPAVSAITRFDVRSLGLIEPQGLTVDPVSGHLFVLDAAIPRIVGLAPDWQHFLDGAVALRDGRVSQIDLRQLADVQLRGLAFNSNNRHFYILSAADHQLYELTETGEVISVRDLAPLQLGDPQGMVFAPSGDPTDDPANLNLYIADSGLQGQALGRGQVVEVSLIAPKSTLLAANNVAAGLINIIDMAPGSPSSLAPSGLAYWPASNTLLVSAAQVDEWPQGFTGNNVFETTTTGNPVAAFSVLAFTNEPAGIAVNPRNGHLFFSDDDQEKIFEVDPGPDGLPGTADDVVTAFDTSAFNSFDPKGLGFGHGNLFIADGLGAEVYIVAPGANRVFDGAPPAGDDRVTSFDTATLGQLNPESVEFNGDSGTLYILSNSPDSDILETTTSGAIVEVIDISAANAIAPTGLTYVPGSLNTPVRHLYIADRGFDNVTDPDENHGKVFAMAFGGSLLPDVIFADGYESGDFSAWSSSTTDDGDLSANVSAALIGANGVQAVIDDNNDIYLTDIRPAAETHYRARFYFDPNSIRMADGDAHYIFYGLADANTPAVRVEFRYFAGDYLMRAGLFDNDDKVHNAAWFTISDAPHSIELDWRAAGAAGGLTLWVDGQQQANLIGVDNDAYRVRSARLGAVTGVDVGTRGTYFFDAFESRRQTYIGPDTNAPPPPDAIFSAGFESGDYSLWSLSTGDGGDLSVNTGAALVGANGLELVLNDNNPIYLTDSRPAAEARYRARFYFDPNSIVMAPDDAHYIFYGYSGASTVALRVEFRFLGGSYQLRTALLDDESARQNSNWINISDAPHLIEIDWRAATAAGANNGGLTFWIDGTQYADLSGVDNDTRRIDRIELGAVAGIDSGTRGTYYFDAFESRRRTPIGP